MAQSQAGQNQPLAWEKPAAAALTRKSGSRLPFMIGGILILVAVGFLIASGTIAGGRFFITVNEVVNDSAYTGQSVRVAGAVIGETIVYDAENLTIEFTIAHIPEQYTDLATALHEAVENPNATHMRVRVENSIKPELLQHEAQAILTGRLGADGVFLATELNLKCPTRFIEAGPAHDSVAPDSALPADHPASSGVLGAYMLAEIGLAAIVLAFAAAVIAIIASVVGARRLNDRLVLSGRNAALMTFPLLLLASLVLLAALMAQQYQIAYVWQVSDPFTPDLFRLTALWGSQQGSLLFWCLLMSGFSFVALLINWKPNRVLMPYFIAYTMATVAFFVGLVLFFENPFDRFWITPDLAPDAGVPAYTLIPPNAQSPSPQLLAESARGLNPLLRHIGMIIHPPMLYLGFVGFVIPFAFAMSALASGDLSSNWIKATRRWTLIAWLFLSLGLILGGRWAYDVLGWGGYWGWDPVENAAFLPWLIGTAFLHSVMIQEKRGMLKVWNMFLVIFTFSAVIFGTFATRSGLVESVHSFAQSEIGMPMFFFWGGMTLVSVYLILMRWRQGKLKDEHVFAGILSRETLFVLNNVVFVALALAIFWGSFGAPILSELFAGTEITLGAEYFYAVTTPLFVVLYILMGIAPLSAWGATAVARLGRALVVPLVLTAVSLVVAFILGAQTGGSLFGYGVVLMAGFVSLYEIYRGAAARHRITGESYPRAVMALFGRNRRRYGGFIVHLGITVIGIGVIGSTLFQQETQRTLRLGEALDFGGYTITYDQIHAGQIAEDGRIMDIADLRLVRGGNELAMLRPRYDFYPNATGMNSQIIAGAYSTLENDVYVLLSGFQTTDGIVGATATFKVYINPLINLVWYGGIILILGTLISVAPAEAMRASERAASDRASRAGAVA